ncbi:DUF2520 domain-containing protein [bacterium]|nr:DUF2520 domain-containing protein [bacterium]
MQNSKIYFLHLKNYNETMNTQQKKLKIGILDLKHINNIFINRLDKAGYCIKSVWDNSEIARNRFSSFVSGKFQISYNRLKKCNFLLICVPDNKIISAIAEIKDLIPRKSVLVHTSGISGHGILSDYAEEFNTGAMHPFMAFPSVPDKTISFNGIGFGITADEAVTKLLKEIVHDLGGFPVTIPDDKRVLYHASAVFASNFTVFLEKIAGDIIEKTGITQKESHKLIAGLTDSVRNNLSELTPDKAISGPVVRGDWQTVDAHLRALEKIFPEFAGIYKEISRLMTLAFKFNPLP